MLPPGHVAAGFLTAYAVVKIFNPNLDPSQINQLLALGAFFGFVPDLDNFMAFAKVKSWYYYHKDNSIHRRFYSHIPLLWLIAGSLIYLTSSLLFVKYLGLLVWLASWSHFLLDSIEYGVMWLWPFNFEVWAFKNRGVAVQIDENSFARYWMSFLKLYFKRPTFYFEIIILIIALLVFLRVNF